LADVYDLLLALCIFKLAGHLSCCTICHVAIMTEQIMYHHFPICLHLSLTSRDKQVPILSCRDYSNQHWTSLKISCLFSVTLQNNR